MLHRATEISCERRAVRHIGFPAAVGATGATRAVERERHVPELAGDIVPTAQQLSVNHHADADTVRDADEDDVPRDTATSSRMAHACARAHARPELSITTGRPLAAASCSRSLTLRQPSVGACSTACSIARPCQARRPPCRRTLRYRDARPSARQRGREQRGRLRITHGGKPNDTSQWLADLVGQHQKRLGRADIDRGDGTPARIDVEERRFAAAGGLAGWHLRR